MCGALRDMPLDITHGERDDSIDLRVQFGTASITVESN